MGQEIWDELLQFDKAYFLKKLSQNTLKACFSFQATLSIVYYRLKLGYHFQTLAATLHSADFPSYLHRENWNVMSQAGWLCRNCGYMLSSLSLRCLGESPWDLEPLQQGSLVSLSLPVVLFAEIVQLTGAKKKGWRPQQTLKMTICLLQHCGLNLQTRCLLLEDGSSHFSCWFGYGNSPSSSWTPALISCSDLQSWPAHLALLREIFFNSNSAL